MRGKGRTRSRPSRSTTRCCAQPGVRWRSAILSSGRWCAAACPSDCIYIEAQDDPRPYAERIGRDERYAKVYNIDYGRCIFCGFCVEACPKDAITHGYNFELSVYNRADLLKTKDDLLITKQVQSKNYRVALSSEDVDSEYKEV